MLCVGLLVKQNKLMFSIVQICLFLLISWEVFWKEPIISYYYYYYYYYYYHYQQSLMGRQLAADLHLEICEI